METMSAMVKRAKILFYLCQISEGFGWSFLCLNMTLSTSATDCVLQNDENSGSSLI